jgi:hypothetical protein
VFVSGRLELGEARRPAAAAATAAVGEEDGEASVGYAMKPQIIAEEISPLTEKRRSRAKTLELKVWSEEHDPEVIHKLREALRRFPGNCVTVLNVRRREDWQIEVLPGGEFAIDPTDDLLRVLDELLGPGSASLR